MEAAGGRMTNRAKRIGLLVLVFLLAAYGSIASYGEHRDLLKLLGGFGIAYGFFFLGDAYGELRAADEADKRSFAEPASSSLGSKQE